MFVRVIIFSAVIHAFTSFALAQNQIDQFRRIMRQEAAFGDGDFSELDKGEAVVKPLSRKDKKEVAVCGVLRLPNLSATSFTAFRDSLSQRDNKTILAGSKFNTPPVVGDLESLELEKRDIDDLKKCAVGKCDIKMSAAMITRLQSTVDWNAPEYRSQTTQIFRQMLVEYVLDYETRGEQGLMQYDNRKQPLRLADEHRMLLDASLFLDELAPEFTKYMRNFPRADLAGVENRLDWANVNFGVKPIITITHTISYANQGDSSARYLIATKGIYASRYVDSSLALSMLLRFPSGGSADTYLVFTNISRSDSLGGFFGSLKRGVVNKEAEDRVRDMLLRARLRLEADANGTSKLAPPADDVGISASIRKFGQNPLIIALLVISAVVIVVLLYRRRKG